MTMIFVGDDWAEAHHDVYVMDEAGDQLGYRRLSEGLEGIGAFHDLVAGYVDDPADVVIGIETDRGRGSMPWLLVAIRCMQSTRWRCHVTGTGTPSQVPSLILVTPSCLPISCVPIGTIIARLLVTVTWLKLSKCWRGVIRT